MPILLSVGNTPAQIAGVAPTLDYRFARDRSEIETISLTDKLTFTGGAEGTFVGPDGTIQQAVSNTPRFTHESTSLLSKGVLFESSRQNLILASEDYTSANWGKAGISVSGNTLKSPDGRIDADIIIENTANSMHLVEQFTPTSATTYTYSFYAKAAGRSVISFGGGGFAAQGFTAEFNLISGTMSANAGSKGSISEYNNGWYRCSVSFTTSNTNIFQVFLLNASSQATYTGDGASGVYLWGAQVEAAATGSSYIPTTTAAVTRTADSATINGSDVITGTYTMVEKPEGCATVSGTDILLNTGYTAERVMVFPTSLSAGQITAIRAAM